MSPLGLKFLCPMGSMPGGHRTVQWKLRPSGRGGFHATPSAQTESWHPPTHAKYRPTIPICPLRLLARCLDIPSRRVPTTSHTWKTGPKSGMTGDWALETKSVATRDRKSMLVILKSGLGELAQWVPLRIIPMKVTTISNGPMEAPLRRIPVKQPR